MVKPPRKQFKIPKIFVSDSNKTPVPLDMQHNNSNSGMDDSLSAKGPGSSTHKEHHQYQYPMMRPAGIPSPESDFSMNQPQNVMIKSEGFGSDARKRDSMRSEPQDKAAE